MLGGMQFGPLQDTTNRAAKRSLAAEAAADPSGSRHPGQLFMFERSRSSAVLLMQRQLEELQQELQESRGLSARHAHAMASLRQEHKQQLRDAQAGGEADHDCVRLSCGCMQGAQLSIKAPRPS